MSFGGVLKDKDGGNPDLDGPDPPRWPDAGWLDGPLVMGRLDGLARLRERRAAVRASRVGVWEVTCVGGHVRSVVRRQSSGVDELDALVESLYSDAEAPFGSDLVARVRLHPPGSGPWPEHVRGPDLLDRRAVVRELPRPRPDVELEVKLEGQFVRQVRVVTEGVEPEVAEACAAVFRGAELPAYRAGAEWVPAGVAATHSDW